MSFLTGAPVPGPGSELLKGTSPGHLLVETWLG
jgi:hypothetical protein